MDHSVTTQPCGNDLEYNIQITLEESAFCEKEIKFPRTEKCSTCDGKGSKNPEDVHTCNTCKGAGQARFAQGFSLFNNHVQNVMVAERQ